MKIIDLSDALSLEGFLRNAHAGTHIEAPAFLFEEGKTIDQYGLEAFVKPAVLLDLTHKEPGQGIDDEDLEAAEEHAGLALREGEAVILHIGMGGPRGDMSSSRNHPFLSQNGAEFLEFKRPSIVGIDAPNLDPDGERELPAHALLLRAEIILLEGLCKLDKIDQSRFQLLALPLKLKASASPVRAAAILDD